MNKSSCFIIIFSFISSVAFSQLDSTRVARTVLYIEVVGAGGFGSINYERVLCSKHKTMLSVRIGTSTYHVKDYTNRFNPDIIVPIMLNGCYGNKHKLELGFGQVVSSIVEFNTVSFNPKRTIDFHSILSVGYRYQKRTQGIFYRLAYTPVIEFNKFPRSWGGISVGYSF